MRVLSIELDSRSAQGTDLFISRAGLEWVGIDRDLSVVQQFYSGSYQPYFVVINGVAGSGTPGLDQWEIMLSGQGFPGVATLRALIDSVQAGMVSPPEISGYRIDSGFFEITIKGAPNRNWVVRSATQLGMWGEGVVVTTDSEGNAVFRELMEGVAVRFYQVVFE